MSELPKGWCTRALATLMDGGVFIDGDWVESKDQDPAGPIRLTQLADVGDGRFLDKSARFMTAEAAKRLNCTFLEPGDVLISRMAHPLGRACIFPGDPAHRCVTVVDVCIARPPTGGVSSKWLMYAVNSPAFRGSLDLLASGTTRKRISRRNLGGAELPVPPLNEQRRIVAKVDALSERSRRAKQSLDAIPPLLDKLRKSVLASAFRGDLTREWRAQHPDVEPASLLLERIRQERRQRWEQAELEKMRAKGKEPKDDKWKAKYKEPTFGAGPHSPTPTVYNVDFKEWAAAPLEAICDPVRGIPYGIVQTGSDTPGGVPTVRCGDVKDFCINSDRLKRVDPTISSQYDRTRLTGGEVLLAIRGTVGATAVAGTDMAGMNISREVAMIPLLPGIVPEYLMYLLASPVGQACITGQVKGVAQAGINLSDVRTLPVPLPSTEEQKCIVERIEEVLARSRDLLAGASVQMLALDRAILAKAFQGELVGQDPTDEPAAVMLERIRHEAEASAPAKKRATKHSRKQAG